MTRLGQRQLFENDIAKIVGPDKFGIPPNLIAVRDKAIGQSLGDVAVRPGIGNKYIRHY